MVAAKFKMSLADHRKIRRGTGVQQATRKLAESIAKRAEAAADAPDGYGVDSTLERDRARSHVWPQTGKALGSERKHAHLATIAAEQGPRR